MTKSVKKVSVVKRQDPLNDFVTLTKIGLNASRTARKQASLRGVSYTYAKNGKILKRNPDGSEQLIRERNDIDNFPPLESDLCQG